MNKKRGDDAQDHADREVNTPAAPKDEGERTKDDGAVQVEDLNSAVDEGAN